MSAGTVESDGGGDAEISAAFAYLAGVAERPTGALWDLVDAAGPVEAARMIGAGAVSERVRAATAARATSVDGAALLEATDRVGARFLHPGSADWPALAMRPLDRPRELARERRKTVPATVALRPFGLWWRGPAPVTAATGRAVAVVGTRAPTGYGRSVAADLAAGVATRGFAVVSGGAFGIDAAAHRAALGVGATTVAVLAGGVDHLYPRGNAALLEDIAATGALVSAYPPGDGVTRYRFLDRNRLVAAMSGATVVVEAARRSGALSTAAWARNLGRPVGAVPGPVTSVASLGCHHLLREEQAVLVRGADDVVELAGDVGELTEEPPVPASPFDGLDDDARRVLEACPPRGGATVEEIVAASAVAPGVVRRTLGRLRSEGAVTAGPSGWTRAVAQPGRGAAALF